MRRLASKFWIAIIIWGVAGALAGAGDAKIAPRLEERIGEVPAGDLVPVIVQTHGAPTSGDLALVRSHGGRGGKAFSMIEGLPARLPAGRLHGLARSSRIRQISLDWQVLSLMDSATPYTGAPAVWRDYGVRGQDVAVAVVDSGMNESQDLTGSGGGRRVLHVDMLSGAALVGAGAEDRFGHGTHVAGIVSGSGAQSSGSLSQRTFRGVAPEADIISIRALDAGGAGNTSDILRALDWVVANKATYRIGVVNLSLGHPIDESYQTDPLCQAVEAVWKAGIVVVVSAGNFGQYGYSSILSPANDPYVITVGAAVDRNTLSTDDDAVASFSSMGPTSIDGVIKPDLLASGVQIVSTRAAGSTIDVAYPITHVPYSFYLIGGTELPSPYAAYSGTSMAAPVVAGAAALMLSKSPTLNPDTIKARLMAAAHPLHDEVVKTGAGMLDIAAALARTDIVKKILEARSPYVMTTTNPDGTTSTSVVDGGGLYGAGIDPTINGQIAIWGNYASWGQIAIWGGASSAQIAIWGLQTQSVGDVLGASE